MPCSNKYKNKKKEMKTRSGMGEIPIQFLRIVPGLDLKFHMPRLFVRDYGDGLSESALIQAPTGPQWEVELKRGDGQVWFGKGWKEFVNYFSLKTGSSLVFRYEGHSRFNVLFIFDSDALETNYPNGISCSEKVNRDVKPRIPEVEKVEKDHDSAGMMSKSPASKGMRSQDMVEIESDDESDGIMESNIPTHDRKMDIHEVVETESDHDSAGITGGNVPTYKRMGIQDKQNVPRKYGSKNRISPVEEASGGASASWRCRSFEAPRKMQSFATKREARALRNDANFNSELPFFEVAMNPFLLARDGLYIPVTFRRRHLTEKPGDVILQSMDGRTWSVRYNVYERCSSAWFHRGWKEFKLDNNLQAGDTCRFELQKGLKMCFTVTISRAVEGASYHFAAGHVGRKRCLKTGSQSESGCTSKYEGATPPRASKESNVALKKIKTKHGMFPQVMHGDRAAGQSISRLLSKENVRAVERASKLKSNHPSFKIVITACFLQRSMPSVPLSFCKEYLKCIYQYVMLQIKDKFWTVKLLASSTAASRFGAGWLTFALENNLQQGDVCVFEMINANPVVFEVTIFSGSSQ